MLRKHEVIALLMWKKNDVSDCEFFNTVEYYLTSTLAQQIFPGSNKSLKQIELVLFMGFWVYLS